MTDVGDGRSWAGGALSVGRAAPVLLAASVVVWVAPILGVPILACLAVPVAFPALFVFAFCPLMAVKPDLPPRRALAGGVLLLLGGLANVVLTMFILSLAQELSRSNPYLVVPLLRASTVGGGLMVWGLLAAGASLGRQGGVVHAGLFATAFVAVGPLASVVLALYSAAGLPMGT